MPKGQRDSDAITEKCRLFAEGDQLLTVPNTLHITVVEKRESELSMMFWLPKVELLVADIGDHLPR